MPENVTATDFDANLAEIKREADEALERFWADFDHDEADRLLDELRADLAADDTLQALQGELGLEAATDPVE